VRNRPTYTYCGLTLVLSQPSRFDKLSLLTGSIGHVINNEMLSPYVNRWQCDVRTADTLNEGLLTGTRGILLFGERAFHEWLPEYKEYSIGEQRGNKLNNKYGCIVLCSFNPQDALDIVDWENKLNEHLIDSALEDEDIDDEYDDTKKHGKTARSNYRFWLQRDIKKLCSFLYPSKIPKDSVEFVIQQIGEDTTAIKVYPNSAEVVDRLSNTKSQHLYLDIETDSKRQMLCFGFGFDNDNIFVVPSCRYTYNIGYHNLPLILKALTIAMRDNTTVIHNTQFDLWILAQRYRIPYGQNLYDTMLAQHRCFPETEKSLGHAISLWLHEEFHKDQGIFEPQNADQEQRLWQYNGLDVKRMRQIHRAQTLYAAKNPGLKSSIELSNRCCGHYLLNTLMGMRYNEDLKTSMMAENDRLMMQYLRGLRHLVGPENVDKVKGKSKAGLLTSNAQTVRYFHEMMGYPILKRTTEGKPALGAETLYRLKQRHKQNMVIDILLRYRELAKETGSLKFNPLFDKDGRHFEQIA
jgi:hypothetical protein